MRIEEIIESPFIPLSVILRTHAARRGDAIAMADETSWISWGDLDRMLDRVAAALQREGVQANEPIAIAASNAVNTGLAFLGALRAGVAGHTVPSVQTTVATLATQTPRARKASVPLPARITLLALCRML